MKLCINCVHFEMERHTISKELGKCTQNVPISLVTGDLTSLLTLPFCKVERLDSGPCGPDGLLFEEKEASNV